VGGGLKSSLQQRSSHAIVCPSNRQFNFTPYLMPRTRHPVTDILQKTPDSVRPTKLRVPALPDLRNILLGPMRSTATCRPKTQSALLQRCKTPKPPSGNRTSICRTGRSSAATQNPNRQDGYVPAARGPALSIHVL